MANSLKIDPAVLVSLFSQQNMEGIPRPDSGGRLGKPIKIETNIFPITALGAVQAYQYNVKFSVDKLPADMCNRAFQQAETLIKVSHPNAW